MACTTVALPYWSSKSTSTVESAFVSPAIASLSNVNDLSDMISSYAPEHPELPDEPPDIPVPMTANDVNKQLVADPWF